LLFPLACDFLLGEFSRFVAAVTERPPCVLTPCIAMLALRDPFQHGFLNYYLSVGAGLALPGDSGVVGGDLMVIAGGLIAALGVAGGIRSAFFG